MLWGAVLLASFVASSLGTAVSEVRGAPPEAAEVSQAAATPNPSLAAIVGRSATAGGSQSSRAGAAPDVGGRGFALRVESGAVALSWTAGVGQTGYLVARLASGGVSFLPPTGPLLANAASYVDPTPLQGLNCYALVPIDASGPVGSSDWLCVVPNTGSPVGAPRLVTIQLNQTSTATFTWVQAATGGQDGYLLWPLGDNPIPLPGNAQRGSHTMAGDTCYVLVPTLRGVATGASDILCGLPGRANLGVPTAGRFRGGALPSDLSGTSRINLGGNPGAGAGSIDLSLQVPPIGDQGSQNSCTGWAVAYYAKSYYEAREQQWNVADHRFSPAFIYNQCNAGRRAGQDEGCGLTDALRVLQQTGALRIDEFPYDPSEYRRQPTGPEQQGATPFRAAGFGRLWGSGEAPSVEALRQALASFEYRLWRSTCMTVRGFKEAFSMYRR